MSAYRSYGVIPDATGRRLLLLYRIVEHTEPKARWEWERVFPGLVKRLLERTRP